MAMNGTKIIGGLTLTALAAIGIVKGVSLYNKTKNAINNIQFLFSFVRVQGLVGSAGVTLFTNPVLEVIFKLEIKNLSEFNIKATNIVAAIQTLNGTVWETIGLSDTPFEINTPAKGGKDEKLLAIDFKGLSTLSSISKISNKKYRALITYQYKGTSLQYIQEIPLQQYLKLSIDKLKGGLNLKGIDTTKNTLALAG